MLPAGMGLVAAEKAVQPARLFMALMVAGMLGCAVNELYTLRVVLVQLGSLP